MLDAFFQLANDPAAEPDLLRLVGEHGASLRASARRGDRSVVAAAEAALQADPGALSFEPSGTATLHAAGRAWAAGRFEAVSIGELRSRAKARAKPGGARARLWLLDGAGPASDIGSLQGTAGEGSLFQVASQFNCLESPGPYISPVVRYFSDPTQGPRASISAFPGTLLRHYAAPGAGGERFVQTTDGRQINLLDDVCDPSVACPTNGYLMDDSVRDPRAFLRALEERPDAVKVGVHDGVEVAFGFDWDGGVEGAGERRIAQVLTSTVAGGGYGGENLGPLFEPLCAALQRAAYLGTLLAAASLGKRRAVLTLIGGGVFGNPVRVIWEAIVRAVDDVAPLLSSDLDVVVNGRDLARRLPQEQLLDAVRARGGAMLVLERSGNASIHR